MNIKIASTQAEFFSLMRVRALVFMKEQNVDPAIENDLKDPSAIHFVVYIDNMIVATCRVVLENGYHIGRLAVLEDNRKLGIGSKLLHYVEKYAMNNNINRLELGAQIHAIPFYEKNGFKCYGKRYKEANIEHSMMEKYV